MATHSNAVCLWTAVLPMTGPSACPSMASLPAPAKRTLPRDPRSSEAWEAPLSSSQSRLRAEPYERFPLARNTMQSRRATAIEYVLVACMIALLVTVYFRGDFGAPKACHAEAPLKWTAPPNRA